MIALVPNSKINSQCRNSFILEAPVKADSFAISKEAKIFLNKEKLLSVCILWFSNLIASNLRKT